MPLSGAVSNDASQARLSPGDLEIRLRLPHGEYTAMVSLHRERLATGSNGQMDVPTGDVAFVLAADGPVHFDVPVPTPLPDAKIR